MFPPGTRVVTPRCNAVTQKDETPLRQAETAILLVALERPYCICRSVAQRPAGVSLVQFVGDAFVGEADEFRERRVRTTGTARQRWDEAANRGPWVAIEGPQIDGLGRAAGRTAHPQEPMPSLERAADRRRERHRHALGPPFIPRCDEAAGVFEDLGLGRALCMPLRSPRLPRYASILRRLKDFAAAARRELSGPGICHSAKVYVSQSFAAGGRGREHLPQSAVRL